MHIDQGVGKLFEPGVIKGYFNDLTAKVTKDPKTLKAMTIPITTDEHVGEVIFPIAIFQYGLGAYDLYLSTNEEKYKIQFFNCVQWALDNQEAKGSWNNFGFIQPESPYSSMCQGEGVSLLLRAYVQDKDKKYLETAKRAIDFMLKPISDGGTTIEDNNGLYLYEYTNKECVLNGWIFSLFGLYEYTLINSSAKYTETLNKTIQTLANILPEFDCGYWSKYDLGKTISSPFYHKLHCAQLKALYLITENDKFSFYHKKWVDYSNRGLYRTRAFINKAIQKVKE